MERKISANEYENNNYLYIPVKYIIISTKNHLPASEGRYIIAFL